MLLELYRNIDTINTQTLYIISTNYTLLYACAIRRYYKKHTPNVFCKIRREYTEKLNNQIKSDPYCLALFIGFTHILDNNSLNNIPKKKYGLIQIEQLNQTQYYYQTITLEAIRLITDSVFTIDYSFANLQFYPHPVKNKIRYFDIFKLTDYVYKNYITTILAKVKDIDVLFIGTINKRRRNIIDNLNMRLNTSIIEVANIFGDELVELLQRTQIVINLHYYDNCIFEVFRIFDILQNSRCNIISEKPDLACEQYLITKHFTNVSFIDTIHSDSDSDSGNDNPNVDYLYNTIKNILLI